MKQKHKLKQKLIAIATVGMTLLGGLSSAIPTQVLAEDTDTDNQDAIVYQADIEEATPTITSQGYGTTVVKDTDSDAEYLTIRNNTCYDEIAVKNPAYIFTADDDFIISSLQIDGTTPADFKKNSTTYTYTGSASLVAVTYDTKSGEDLFEDFNDKAKTVKQVNNMKDAEDKTIVVKYLYADQSLLGDLTSINDVVLYSNAIISQDEEYVTLAKQDEQYYFTATTPYDNGYATSNPLDWQFAQGNDTASLITEGVSFDSTKKTGTISQTVFDLLQPTEDNYADVQIQILVPVELGSKVSYPVTIENNMSSVKPVSSYTVYNEAWTMPKFLLVRDTDSRSQITEDNIELYVNGSDEPLTSDFYAYDEETGYVGFIGYSNQVSSVRIVLNDIKGIVANAITYNNVNLSKLQSLEVLAYLDSSTYDYSSLTVGQTWETTGAFFSTAWPDLFSDVDIYKEQLAKRDTYFKLYDLVNTREQAGMKYLGLFNTTSNTHEETLVGSEYYTSIGIPTNLFNLGDKAFQFYDENGNPYATVTAYGKSKLEGNAAYNSYIPMYCHHTAYLSVNRDNNWTNFAQPTMQFKILSIKQDGELTKITISCETTKYQFAMQTMGTVFTVAYKNPTYSDPVVYTTNAQAEDSVTDNLSVTAYKQDSSTSTALAGASFDLYVKGWDSSDFVKVGTATSDSNGKITATASYTKSFSATSEEYEYVTNYDSLSSENQAKYQYKSESEAYNAALSAAKEQVANDKNTYINSTKEWKLVETSAPAGYAKTDTVLTGTFTTNTATVTNAGTFENAPNLTASLIKEDSVTKEAVAGAKLTLTDNTTGNIVKEWTSTSEAEVITGLRPNSSYTITEVQAPTGYVLPAVNTQTVTTGDADSTNTWTFENWKVTFTKADLSGEEVIGAKIVVTDAQDNIVDEWYSTAEPHNIKNLAQGNTYTLTETAAPRGFTIVNSMSFTVGDAEQNLTMNDTVARVYKVDADGNALVGAYMQVLDSQGSIMDSWQTGRQILNTSAENYTNALSTTVTLPASDLASGVASKTVKEVHLFKSAAENEYQVGIIYTEGDADYYDITDSGKEAAHRISNIVAGQTYLLHEVSAPTGYIIAQDTTFTASAEEDTVITITDKQTTFSKLDAGGEEVVGATLEVLDQEENVVDTWQSTTEPHNIENLAEGQTYTIRETIAPAGYSYAQEYTFVAGEEASANISLVDTIQYVAKQTANGDYLTGASLQIVDSEGNIIDQWVSGQSIINLTKEQTYNLTKGTPVEFDKEITLEDSTIATAHYVITPKQVSGTTATNITDEPEGSGNSILDGLSEALSTVSDVLGDVADSVQNTVAPTYDSFLLQIHYNDTYEYYIIDANGNEKEHMVRNANASTEYTVVETQAPTGYVLVADTNFTIDSATNSVLTLTDKQVHFTKEDINGEEVEGACLTVYDESSNVVDTWISTSELHEINGLQEGHSYTLVEEIAPEGYTQATAIDFTVTADGIDSTIKMVDTIQRIIKESEDGVAVKGARLAVYDSNNNLVDEWTTGTHILDITKEQFAQADSGEVVTLVGDDITSTVDESIRTQMYTAIDELLASVIPDIDYIPADDDTSTDTSEEEYYATLTLAQKIQKIFEGLPISADELQTYIDSWQAEVSTLTQDSNRNTAEDIRKKLYSEADDIFNEVSNEVKEQASKLETVVLYANKESAGGYTLRMISADATVRYVDINEYGSEANHRVKGMIVGEEYTLKELMAPTGYDTAMSMSFVADSNQNLSVTMVDEYLLGGGKSDTGISKNPLAFIGGTLAVVVLVAAGAIIIVRKKHK
jgi:hypothetical protein